MDRKQEAIRHVLESDDYRADFPGWLHENWAIYVEFERQANRVLTCGRRHYSARTIAEVIRHESNVRDGTEYKLNGNIVPDLARLFEHLNPEAAGLFEFRERRAAA